MKLAEALAIVNRARSSERTARVALACGFTPLHFSTFLGAEIARRSGAAPEIVPGLFDDLLGTLTGLDAKALAGVVVALEWSDLDARLGVRGAGGWRPSNRADLLASVERRLGALGRAIDALGEKGDAPLVLALPSLPLPPMFGPPAHRAAPEALELRAKVLAFAAARVKARVIDPQALDEASAPASRVRLATALQSGFPMTVEHASQLAALAAEALYPPAPLKGIITDLDDTVWRGILGEEGVDGVHWSLDRGSHGHALYQEMLASLAELGVLVGVVSKNDPALVEKAFARKDLVLPRDKVATIEAGWGLKSEAIKRTLRHWNIAPDAVVFVDDSAFERGEVQRLFPDMRCLEFPTHDDDALWQLLRELRARFGKARVTEEDALRAKSLQAGAVFREDVQGGDEEAILADANATLTFELDTPDVRSFELVNKTNQFNLNGRRIDEATWQARTKDPDTFIASVTYTDKYAPLGKIAVVVGRRGAAPTIDAWVMSCRAFSRRIEHHTLKVLFDALGASAFRLEFEKTERNGPFEDFLRRYTGGATIERATFDERCPRLYGKGEVHGGRS